ncbi:MAG: polyprenyl synthetase family protein [Acidimicrobiales bacterium]
MAGRAPSAEADPLPAGLRAVASRVEARVLALLDAETERWGRLDPGLVEPLDAVRSLVLAGGKRLRPVFCHWGFVAAGGDRADDRWVDAGAAFEMLQAFALIHDDVMDGSATRRGAPAVHRRFDRRHHAAGWSGESRRFGEGVAILAGDLALVYSDLLLPDAPAELWTLWHELRIELNIGQYLDLAGTATGGVGRQGARRIARMKSGRYTIERPLQVGAILAGDAALAERVSAYGDPLGEAFQLRDDVLGVYGVAERTGKPVGDDLREGKPTQLLAVAAERADAAGRALLARVGGELDDDLVAQLQDLLRTTGALDEVEAEIAALHARAVGALDQLGLGAEAAGALRDLADFVVARDA